MLRLVNYCSLQGFALLVFSISYYLCRHYNTESFKEGHFWNMREKILIFLTCPVCTKFLILLYTEWRGKVFIKKNTTSYKNKIVFFFLYIFVSKISFDEIATLLVIRILVLLSTVLMSSLVLLVTQGKFEHRFSFL